MSTDAPSSLSQVLSSFAAELGDLQGRLFAIEKAFLDPQAHKLSIQEIDIAAQSLADLSRLAASLSVELGTEPSIPKDLLARSLRLDRLRQLFGLTETDGTPSSAMRVNLF